MSEIFRNLERPQTKVAGQCPQSFWYEFGNLRRFGGEVLVDLLEVDVIHFLVGQGIGWLWRTRLLSRLFSIPGVAFIVN